MTIQGLFTWYGEVVPLNIHERLARWGEQASLRRARVVTTESTFAVDFLRRRHPNLTVRQVEHAPNWVFHHVRRHPQLQPVRFLTVGTPGFRKGTDLLLRALGQVVNEFSFELISVGVPSDDFLAPLRRELPGDLWKFVQFRPAVTPAAIAEEMALATIFVLPTRADTSPNAVKEAAVAGVPVVASDVGGVPDYIASGRNGLLFRSGDLAGLVGVLREAVRHPLFGAGDVEPAILSGVRDYLSPATMARKFLAVYDEVLAARAPADG
jgi:glycosyltransferase involved in cell wall biosynthesis